MLDPFAEIHYVDLPPNRVAYREVGEGEPLLLVHGYPLSGATFRHIAPALAGQFRCIVPDLLGAGLTEWTAETDFGFAAQAQTLKDLADALGLSAYRVLAHDTGGTIARRLALIDPDRVTSMVLIGTEIPGHRPAFIPFLQRIANPRATLAFKVMMRSRLILASKLAFGGCFWDRKLIFGEFADTHLAPVLASDRRIQGLTHYLLGIDWELLDSLAEGHRHITAPTLLLWGAEDTVFPVALARAMADQLANCRGFVTVPHARLFVHEERPDEVVAIAREFFATDSVAATPVGR
jgi:pimeloyl-ACP methyl ester carboxylesterase